jgi:FkbM family methyltransferase
MTVDDAGQLAGSGGGNAVRRVLRSVLTAVPTRGRHRLVAMLGRSLGSDRELLTIGGLRVEIDHAITACRYMYYGLYEEHLVNWIARTIRPGDAVVEAGANIGHITGHLLARMAGSGLLIAMEPSNLCIERLRRTNDLAALPNLQLLHAAIACNPGRELFWETTDIVAHGYGYLQPANWDNSTAGTSYEVPTRSIDEIMDHYSLERLAFLKLDVEGSEWPAIQGAARALRDGRIDHVMVETYIDRDAPRHEAEIIDFMAVSGYRPHLMSRTGRLTPVDLRTRGCAIWRGDVMWTKA